MRALTYNLLAGEADDAERLEQATLLLQAAKPNILALNECKLLEDPTRLRALENALGMQARLAEAASGFHLALLIRDGTFDEVEVLQKGFAHAALVASIQIGGSQLQAIVAHLDPFSPTHRLQEVELLLQHVKSTSPTLLLGDLNAISLRDLAITHPEHWAERYRQRHLDNNRVLDTRALAHLEQAGLVDIHAALHTPTEPTRPTSRYARADRPNQRLDYIFASGDLANKANACATYDHPLTETTSDHRPLYADFA